MSDRYNTEFRVEGPMSNRQGYYYIIDSSTGKEVRGIKYLWYEAAHNAIDKMNAEDADDMKGQTDEHR